MQARAGLRHGDSVFDRPTFRSCAAAADIEENARFADVVSEPRVSFSRSLISVSPYGFEKDAFRPETPTRAVSRKGARVRSIN